VKELYEDAGGK